MFAFYRAMMHAPYLRVEQLAKRRSPKFNLERPSFILYPL